MEQIKKYIRGNKERGHEIIAELEKIGGKNILKLKGDECDKVYYIERYKYTNANTIDFEIIKSLTGQLILTHPEWEEIKLPEQFKDGDVVYVKANNYNNIIVYKKLDEHLYRYVNLTDEKHLIRGKDGTVCTKYEIQEIRLATEEEKQKLFDAIKENGYRWNAEKKELEKLIVPKFKVGDRVKFKENNIIVEIVGVERDNEYYSYLTYDNYRGYIHFASQDLWELVPDRFDISTLVPFDKVLVRYNKDNKWCGSFFSHIDKEHHSHCYKYVTTAGKSYPYCIPYEENKHLLGTTDDCLDFYKTWEE